MTPNHLSLISAFKMTFRMSFRMSFRMTFRMTLRMTFKTRDFRGLFKEDFEGDFEGYLKGSSIECLRGSWRGPFLKVYFKQSVFGIIQFFQ